MANVVIASNPALRNINLPSNKLAHLSLPELKTRHGRLLSAAYRVWGEIQKREGMESIETQIACLTKKQQAFVSALWYARGRKMKVVDIEKMVAWQQAFFVYHNHDKERT